MMSLVWNMYVTGFCNCNSVYTIRLSFLMQDGELWTFTVRAFDAPRPERTITVNYDGFAEG